MKNWILGLIFFLGMLTTTNAQVDLINNYDYYNPTSQKFEFVPWKANLLLKWAEEIPLLYDEINLKDQKITSLESDNILLEQDNSRLVDEVNYLKADLSLVSSQKRLYETLYAETKNLNNVGEKSLRGLEFALKWEKIAKNWYRVSTGVTLAAILTYTIVQLTRN